MLRSNGYNVVWARDVFGEGTDDEELLEYCEREDYLFVTHDKKDLASQDSDAGVIVYTDSIFLRDKPGAAVRAVEHVLDVYPTSELRGEVVWLSQWRS